jgi:hypothetical protein
VAYFNGCYLRVINPETKVDANNVTVIVRFQWLRYHITPLFKIATLLARAFWQ